MLPPPQIRPRVVSGISGQSLFLEDALEPILQTSEAGVVCVSGPAASGKSRALAHLAARLPRGSMTAILDDATAADVGELSDHMLVVYSAVKPHAIGHLSILELAPWGRDECLEYLLAVHKERCGSVMARLGDGWTEPAELWTAALEELAADEGIPHLDAALRKRLGRIRGRARREAGRLGLDAVLGREGRQVPLGCLGFLFARPLGESDRRLLRHRRVRLILAAEQIEWELWAEKEVPALDAALPVDLVREVGSLVSQHRKLFARLEEIARFRSRAQAMGASILLAADPGWRPEGLWALQGAHLARAQWPGILLEGVTLAGATLNGADLTEARMDHAVLISASLRGATLRGAHLSPSWAEGADFSEADLEAAHLQNSVLCRADLRGANLTRADLKKASMTGAQIEEADFSGADLEGAELAGLDLRTACFERARLARATLTGASLEEMRLPGVDFTGAHLQDAPMTGSVMPGANFRGARLWGAELADVEWQGVDLRDADLTGATFHMGTSRSGLVGGEPGEGSRMGFYADDSLEQHYRKPEDYRKANLCGADLRGANIEGVDFYLVDLRRARYTPEQEPLLRRTGAILDVRV